MTKRRSKKKLAERRGVEDWPKSASDARAFLEVVSEHLRDVENRGRSLIFAEYAINAFLAGEYKSLDEAFGLKRGRGRPPKPGKHLVRAKSAFALRLAGKSYREIADKLSTAHHTFDDKDIRAMLDNYEDHIVDAYSRDAINALDARFYKTMSAKFSRTIANRKPKDLKKRQG